MARYGMVVDLNRCVGCQTCTIACKSTNDTPPGVQWRRVLDVEQGSFPDVQRLFLVTGCQHCAEPPCVPVCPTGATRQREDGLVTMDYDTCIGCASCAVACPYQARTIVHEQPGYYGEQTVQERKTAHAERRGVANKCTFCVERVDQAAASGLTPGVDPQVTPACAVACITQAIRFGDFADPASEVSRLTATQRSFQMHAELGTNPQIKYLYEVPNSMPGRDADAADRDDERLSDLANPLVGARQGFWDYRAAMNFILGGMSSGLAVVAWLAYLGGALEPSALRGLHVAAAAIMALGLFFVFLKIGRKARFLRVLLRPQSSWMTRETWCVAVFYPAVAASFLWPSATVAALAALAAAGFLLCQARIVYASKGIPAWRAPLMPWLLAATGLLEGTGLLAIALGAGVAGSVAPVAGAGIALAALNAVLWWRYRASARANGIGPLSRRDLGALSRPLHALGHAAPAVLFALALAAGPIAAALAALAGVAAVLAGAWWKLVVITRVCHQQGFALPKLPQRGSGRLASPARVPAGHGYDGVAQAPAARAHR
ncbi:MAG: 4Fe-4S dicluster domain-containing protein [Burkholderiales bacterium]|nr:4Fe-4S dicluster domain-containing protein [Burkholderiales bacterium]